MNELIYHYTLEKEGLNIEYYEAEVGILSLELPKLLMLLLLFGTIPRFLFELLNAD